MLLFTGCWKMIIDGKVAGSNPQLMPSRPFPVAAVVDALSAIIRVPGIAFTYDRKASGSAHTA
jgi:hypothetical protein